MSVYTLADFADLPPEIAKMRLEQAEYNYANKHKEDREIVRVKSVPALTLEERSAASLSRISARFKQSVLPKDKGEEHASTVRS